MKRFAVALIFGSMTAMFAPPANAGECNGQEIQYICPWGGGGSICVSHDPPTHGQNCIRPN